MLSPTKIFNLALRAIMEFGIIIALGYWGYKTGDGTAVKVLRAILAPLIGFGFWGFVDFRNAGVLAETLRLAQELAISAAAIFALFTVESQGFGITLGIISLIHHILVYVSGETLLKQASQ